MRASTSWLRVLPTFVIAGTMKGGTTALFRYLAAQPDIGSSSRKEVHFFDYEYGRGLGWYRSHFPSRMRRLPVVGECTPNYMFHPMAMGRLIHSLPWVKLILVLRNPVDRAYSHYQHCRRQGYERLTFDEAIEAEPKRLSRDLARLKSDESYRALPYARFSYLARGVYWRQLEEIYRLIDRDRVLLLRSEDLFQQPAQTLREAASFLDVPVLGSNQLLPRNAGTYPAISIELQERLRAFYGPHNRRLEELTGRYWDWDGDRAISHP